MDVKDQKQHASVMNMMLEAAGQGRKVKNEDFHCRDKYHNQP